MTKPITLYGNDANSIKAGQLFIAVQMTSSEGRDRIVLKPIEKVYS